MLSVDFFKTINDIWSELDSFFTISDYGVFDIRYKFFDDMNIDYEWYMIWIVL